MVWILAFCPLVPRGAIVMFDSIPPIGWQILGEFHGRFPMGTDTFGGSLGGTTSHSHTLTGMVSYGESMPLASSGDSFPADLIPPHSHTVPVITTDTASNIPPYRTFIFAKALMDFDYLPRNAVIMSYTRSLGPGWTDITSGMINLFPRGDTLNPGIIGGIGFDIHSHFFRGTTSYDNPSVRVYVGPGGYFAPAHPHAHTFEGVTNAALIQPPFRTVRFWKAISEPAYYSDSQAILMFDTLPSSCWTKIADFTGRIPKADTVTGINGGSSHHSHTVSTFLSRQDTAAWGIGLLGDYGPTYTPWIHRHWISFSPTSTESHIPPYRTVIFAMFTPSSDVEETIRLNEGTEVEAYNVEGKKVAHFKGETSELSRLKKGVYILVLKEGKTKRIKKYIKTK